MSLVIVAEFREENKIMMKKISIFCLALFLLPVLVFASNSTAHYKQECKKYRQQLLALYDREPYFSSCRDDLYMVDFHLLYAEDALSKNKLSRAKRGVEKAAKQLDIIICTSNCKIEKMLILVHKELAELAVELSEELN